MLENGPFEPRADCAPFTEGQAVFCAPDEAVDDVTVQRPVA
jgi:hypothetical protein